ncbi:hypothetical protein [Aliiglaciecola sp. LCG003]|uniref:hypothetical protein n=1 Tax=Aliiglaciecola sp. LCG003 TaxID=3053655 RepID=UPI0025735C57|nr:hypothetical protein [Aliiglaciecola sp. LCG003]WJG09388.1 hypothetical protein QR722_18995 [Aliiglaciecola sp. LCG003]
MEEVKLLASASVLRVIYDEKKDIYDVLAEFIKQTISERSISAFSSIECVRYLDEDFGFLLPEAIVKSCLRKRLVKAGLITLNSGIYSVAENFISSSTFNSDFQKSRNDYDEIVTRIHRFCNDNGLLGIQKEDVEKSLETYLTRPDKNDKLANEIANFIITYESESGFKDKLDRIEEGLILYTGIRYSPDLSTLGSWRGNLTIFLDSEHLFNAAGLNGTLYKSLFDDFNDLVCEVNRNKKGGRIELKYLEETSSDIESFFYAAEKIVGRQGTVDPSKTAMINICNGCKYQSDVLTKKAEFMTSLARLKINQEPRTDYYSLPNYNVEGSDVLQRLIAELAETSAKTDDISSILKIFTKINVLRKGENNVGIDQISSIFLTESWLPQRMAFSSCVHDGNGAIPFATNIEFLTEKLWFKLNKGFGGKSKMPISFDPVIRAKMTISNQISKSVSSIYRDLSDKYAKGKVDKDVLARIHHEIYKAPSRPEDVSIASISMAHDFLNDSYIEKVINEKHLLEKQASDGQQAISELAALKHQAELRKREPIKAVARRQYTGLRVLTYVIIPLALIYAMVSLYSPSDTSLSVIFGLASFVSLVITIFRPKKIDRFYWSLSKYWYKKSVNKALQRTSR